MPFFLPSPGRYVPDDPLDEASPRRRGWAKATREPAEREEARLTKFKGPIPFCLLWTLAVRKRLTSEA